MIGKLKGTAKLVVNIQNTQTWQELKDTLYRNFADRRDETSLNRDLILMRQFPNEKPQQFFDRCLQILNLLCSYVDIHEETQEARNLKRNLYNNLALKTFLAGLKEPLGTTIRCMKPTSLNEALQLINNEENIQYFQNFTNKQPNKFMPNKPVQQVHQLNRSNIHNTPNFQNMYHPNYNQTRQYSFNSQQRNYSPQQFNFPSQPIQIQQRPNNPPQTYFTNSQVFSPKPIINNHGANKNVFRPNQIKNLPAATPMSISTRQTNNHPNKIWNQQPQYNSSPGELHNTEVNEIGETSYIPDDYCQLEESDQCEEINDHPYEFQEEISEQNSNFQLDPQKLNPS